MRAKKNAKTDVTKHLPPVFDWRTSDEDEINRRRARAETDIAGIRNVDPRHRIFSNFEVASVSGLTYVVEIRDIAARQYHCDCVDFRINGLGTCKHVEAVLNWLQARYPRIYRTAATQGSNRIDLVADTQHIRLERGYHALKPAWRRWFTAEGVLTVDSPHRAVEQLRHAPLPLLRISRGVEHWLKRDQYAAERIQLRREYEQRVQSGEWPVQETLVPLYPYQREGMLHLAFKERALLADEMGLGKTIQAIAACALLNRLGKASRVLVVSPASLKTEWEEQIQKFTGLPLQILFGSKLYRLRMYRDPVFFTLANYEQMRADSLDINAHLRPDIIILDEAQRIKNWETKTAQAIKRLESRFAFVLTGTPIENRIDELYSILGFLDPQLLGPLFRFNREFYELNDRGKPAGYKNLARLRERIQPVMLRRVKADVETQLPDRTDQNLFVKLTRTQKEEYAPHSQQVKRIMEVLKRRPPTKALMDKLQKHLAIMRMICDTLYILDPNQTECPKLSELESILEETLSNPANKVIIFSEWERMLQLVRALLDNKGIGYAWHTGSVPQKRRRSEITAFKTDPHCRIFLSTDSGSVGLNLQNACVVINCDLPWNPAKLEQRIARAWRKHQTQPVTVINLISEGTIEHGMLHTLASKQALADGVLDGKGKLDSLQLASGRQAFLSRLKQLVTTELPPVPQPKTASPAPVDIARHFCERARAALGDLLAGCEERFPQAATPSVLVAVVNRNIDSTRPRLEALYQDYRNQYPDTENMPAQLEVIDEHTFQVIERFAAAGLISPTTRARRNLMFETEPEAKAASLSETDRERMSEHLATAERKLKMFRLLADGELREESQAPLREAIRSLASASALRDHLPTPDDLEACVRTPWSYSWGNARPGIQSLITPGAQVESSAVVTTLLQPILDDLRLFLNPPTATPET